MEIVDRAGAEERSIALRQIDGVVEDLAPGRTASVDLRAAFASEEQNLRLDGELDRAGARPRVAGAITLRGARVEALSSALPAGLGAIVSSGSIDARAQLRPEGEGYRISGEARSSDLMLRGTPASLTMGFHGSLDPPTRLRLEVSPLALAGPGVDLSGRAELTTRPVKATIQLAGDELDLSALLAALPSSPTARPAALPPRLSARLRALELEGSLAVKRVVAGKLTGEDLELRARLADGALRIRRGTAHVYGGVMDLSGTEIDLARPAPSWQLEARVQGLDLGAAMMQTAGAAPLTGVASGTLDLRGAGLDWASLRPTLTGRARLELEDATVQADLSGKVAEAVRAAAKLTSIPPPAAETPLGDLRAELIVDRGWLRLGRPVALATPFGAVELDGRIGLDWRLDLSGTASLAPDFIQELTGGIGPATPLEVPMSIGGSLRTPMVWVELRPEQLLGRALERWRARPQGRGGLFPRFRVPIRR